MRVKFYLILVLIFTVQAAHANDDISLNGTYENKAILLIKGELLMLTQGQTKKGVTLVKVYPNKVDVVYRKKKLSLNLEQSLSDESLGFSKHQKVDESTTHILSARLIEQSKSTAVFNVEYFYDGQHGEYVTLTAKTLFKDKVTEFWSHSYTKLKVGRHQVSITLKMNADAPKMYYSDAIRFEILWASEVGGGELYSKPMQFIKQWKQ